MPLITSSDLITGKKACQPPPVCRTIQFSGPFLITATDLPSLRCADFRELSLIGPRMTLYLERIHSGGTFIVHTFAVRAIAPAVLLSLSFTGYSQAPHPLNPP